jgi:hypothetical protein
VLAVAMLAVSVSPALAQLGGRTCVGRHCGRLLGFPVEHCHVRQGGDPGGEQVCWSSLRGDFACELMGFTVNVPCPGAGGLAAGLASQVATSVGGFNVFRTEIRRTATPRAALEGAPAEPAEEPAEGEQEQPGAAAVLRFGEIRSALEYEDWTLSGVDGETPGARLSWRREAEGGRLLSVAGSYQRAEVDGGVSADLLSASAAIGHTLGDRWRWSVNATASDLAGFLDLQLLGGGAQVWFESYSPDGRVLSGGVTYQLTTVDEPGIDDFQTAGAGVAYGFPVGRRLTVDLDLYAVGILEPDLPDDLFYTGGAELGVYLTPRFGLTAGYRVLEGIDELDSGTLTLGAGARW